MATKDGAEEKFVQKDYHDPPASPLYDPAELGSWSFWRAVIAEFVATLLFLYVTIATVIGVFSQKDQEGNTAWGAGVGVEGIAWAFGGMIFVLVYNTAGISGTPACCTCTCVQVHDNVTFLCLL